MIHGEEKFEKLLGELLDEITAYPATFKKDPGGFTKNSTSTNPQKALSSIQESIEDMRICLKYLLFDLDATRRENHYYKKLLDDKES